MKVKALISFSGLISMHKDEETEITDQEVLNDLLSANYVEEVKTTQGDKEGTEKVVADPSNTTTPKKPAPQKETAAKKAPAQKPDKKGVK